MTKSSAQLDSEIAKSVRQTAALAKLTKAVHRAQSEWTGLDWATDLTVGNLDDAYRGRPKALAAAKAKERQEIEAAAEGAKDSGDEAIEYAKAGNWRAARLSIANAERAERDYGDSPSWRPVLGLVERLEEEIVKAE